MTTLLWFRQDLRLGDNPALAAALENGAPVIPVYIWAPQEEGGWAPGAASRWWLHHSLSSLGQELGRRGSRLIVRDVSDSLRALTDLAAECGADRIVWNRRYEPPIIARDQAIKVRLREQGIVADSFNGALLHEPWTIRTKSGGPFQVFTPFWRHVKGLEDPLEPLRPPSALPAPSRWPTSDPLESLALLPRIEWDGGLRQAWTPGSDGAHHSLQEFLTKSFDDYQVERDHPATPGTSRLSPHLHFGEISPREIWHALRLHCQARGRHSTWRDSQFLAEVGWREFAYHLLYHFPHTPERPLRASYASFPWKPSAMAFQAWSRGLTGYPIVDAGLRELWHTGWMHNRVRMIAGSFLVKDLLINWTEGAHWFWDTLVDADLASNTLGWQWVAGSGADAAPFFRIFNPTTQGQKFDPQGTYVRRWVPELKNLSDEWIHQPSQAPPAALKAAGVVLGEHYPLPVVKHEEARRDALDALSAIKRQ